jgi:hypothetical protein
MLDAKTKEELIAKLVKIRESQKFSIDGLQDAKKTYADRAKMLAEDTAVDGGHFEEGLDAHQKLVRYWQEIINELEIRLQVYEQLVGQTEDKVDENLK